MEARNGQNHRVYDARVGRNLFRYRELRREIRVVTLGLSKSPNQKRNDQRYDPSSVTKLRYGKNYGDDSCNSRAESRRACRLEKARSGRWKVR